MNAPQRGETVDLLIVGSGVGLVSDKHAPARSQLALLT